MWSVRGRADPFLSVYSLSQMNALKRWIAWKPMCRYSRNANSFDSVTVSDTSLQPAAASATIDRRNSCLLYTSLTIMPDWLQTVAQFLPSNYLNLGMQGILLRRESLAQNWQAVAALLATAILCFFVSLKLFRWEKEDRLKPSAKLWVLAALLPFCLLYTSRCV